MKEGDVTLFCSVNNGGGGEDVNSLILIINKHEIECTATAPHIATTLIPHFIIWGGQQ